jgi:hypothetical protein
MTANELQSILEAHKKYLAGATDVAKADLSGADLSDADLRGADLSDANLRGVDLSRAHLSRASLRWADLGGADLRWAHLSGANLRGADLSDADLGDADLRGANLSRADLSRANLRDADLRGADLDFASLPLRCGGLHWQIDRRIAAQLVYHLCSMECADAEFRRLRNSMLDFANQFHLVDSCGKLEPIDSNDVCLDTEPHQHTGKSARGGKLCE